MVLPSYLKFSNNPASALTASLDVLKPDKAAILVDEHTRMDCLPLLDSDLPIIEIRSGEKNKTIDTCALIWQAMTDLGFSRKSLLINVGGGVIGDMGGFAASTYKRGIRFINYPSTLLSMVDASIGGKLGVDFKGLKNHIGVFRKPTEVVVCELFLQTLPHQQIRSGFAEVLKHALIFDEKYWELVKRIQPESADWSGIIKHSIEIKGQVVEDDPMETGLRKILNFGHSLGHAIESHFLDTEHELLHGEAIAIGMVLEGLISKQRGLLSSMQFEEMMEVITSTYAMVWLPAIDELLVELKQDKKNEGENLNFAIIDQIGHCLWDIPVQYDEIELALKTYSNTIQKD